MDLSYLNSRVRGLKGQLFKESDYERFSVGAEPSGPGESVEEFLGLLRPTPYGPYITIAEAAFEDPEQVLLKAFNSRLAAALALLKAAMPKSARGPFKAAIGVFEVNNLKCAIRGIAAGRTREDILTQMTAAGEFDTRALKDIVSVKDIADLARLLESWQSPYAGAIKENLSSYVKSDHLLDIEVALDKIHIEGAKAEGSTGVARLTRSMRADSANIMTLLKTRGEVLEPSHVEGLFIEGGSLISSKLFLSLNKIVYRQELLDAISNAIRDRDVAIVIFDAGADEPTLLEEGLDELATRRLLRLGIVDPEGLAMAIWIVGALVREVKNLRLILRARIFNLPGDMVDRMIFYPGLAAPENI